MSDRTDGEVPLRLAFLGDPNSTHTRRWLGIFADRGHEIHLLVPARDAMRPGLDPRVAVHRFRAWPRLHVRGLGSIVTAWSLRRVLRRVRPDVLHAHSVSRYGLAARLSGFHPYVVTVWGSDVLLVAKANRRRGLQARLALGGADVVTGGSEHLIAAAVAAGARRDRTRFVHFGVETTRFGPGPDPAGLRARLGLGTARVVLSNRTIAPLYRQRVVVSALARLPRDVVVVMTRHAASPDEVAAVEALAEQLGVADRLRIVDQLPESELPDLYRLADVVVSVPESDGAPTTVVEALASGRPVVASDLPAVREWLAGLDPGALVPVGDVEATAGAIGVILGRDSAAAAELARRGREAVAERADRTRNMERMEAIYRELAARRRAGRRG